MRNDIHRVSEIIPANYKYKFSFSYPGPYGDPGFNMQLLAATRSGAEIYRLPIIEYFGGLPRITGWDERRNLLGKLNYFSKEDHGSEAGGCDVCGASFRHGDVWQHVDTGECIVLGHICADKYGLLADRAEFRAYKKAARDMKAKAIERSVRFTGLLTWAREHRELLPLLKVSHKITRDIRGKMVKTGAKWGLSEKQVNLLRKLAEDATKPAEKHVPVPVDGERIQVEGLVVGTKVDDFFGAVKMTVKVETPDGTWMVFGTAPDALFSQLPDGVLKGHRVRFTAKVSKGNRDEYFGFFSRPTKATVVDEIEEREQGIGREIDGSPVYDPADAYDEFIN